MLMRAKEFNRSVEYMDNRLSLYCAQYGKCAVTGRYLEYDEIHCHHKIPRYQGGSDRYNNLIIVHTDIHRLIHAKTQSNIDECLQLWPFDSKTMEKLNKLRIAVGREPIAMT